MDYIKEYFYKEIEIFDVHYWCLDNIFEPSPEYGILHDLAKHFSKGKFTVVENLPINKTTKTRVLIKKRRKRRYKSKLKSDFFRKEERKTRRKRRKRRRKI